MNRIERLIQEFCPEGVTFATLDSITELKSGDRVTKSMMAKDAEFPLFGGGTTPTGRYHLFNAENSVTIARAGSAGFVNFVSGKFWATDVCFVAGQKPGGVNIKYIYYWLKNHQPEFANQIYGGSMPKLNKKYLWSLTIPTPPREVQEGIVSILDKFMQLEAELEMELGARGSQFDILRAGLFATSSESSLVELGSLCEMYSGEFVKKDRQDNKYLYPVYNGGSEPTGFYSEFNSPAESIVIASRGSIGSVSYVNTPFWAGNSCFVLKNTVAEVDYRYLYHYLKHSESELYKLRAVGTIPAINLKPLLKFKVSIPNLHKQQRIAAILDAFEELESSLITGIPAEITARRQQYEYHRNKLLSFKELKAS